MGYANSCTSSSSYSAPNRPTHFDRWEPETRRAAARMCRGTTVDPKDVAQEIRIRVARTVGAAQPLPNAYVRQVIRNTALNAVRNERRANPFARDLRIALTEDEEFDEDHPDQPVPEDLRHEDDHPGREIRARVQEWIAGLPVPLQRVYELLYFEGLTQREAALALGLSQPRVAQVHRSLLARGRRDLAPLLAA